MNQVLENGTVLQGATGRYTILKTLGQGSFGITYLACTQVVGKLGAIDVKVAVKEFFMKEVNSREGSSVTGGSTGNGLFERYRQKFRREAENLSRMHNPGIVKVLESFDSNNTSYIVMEYVGGGSLDDYISRHGALPEREAIRFAQGIGAALDYMHAHQMLHLDLKPSNVMLDSQNNPILIDFGLSKHYDEGGMPESSTTVGGGTPGYAPIEQSSYHEGKEFPVTIDVYALGATVFKMLCGHRPPESDVIINEGFPYRSLEGVSQRMVNAVAKAMAIRKADRYQSVKEFLGAIGPSENLDESTVHTPPIPPEDTIKQAHLDDARSETKSNRKWLYIIIAVMGILMAALLIFTLLKTNLEKEDVETAKVEMQDDNSLKITVNGEEYEYRMVYVRGGGFLMGTLEGDMDASDWELPQHYESVGNYYIGETEVTQALWKAVMGSEPTYHGGWTDEYGRGAQYPAYRVCYNDIKTFITKLNRMTGREFRLPTEAEWEYAARGGNVGHGFKYSGSNRIGEVGWYKNNSGDKAHPVRQKQGNELGLYDMTGNVWEWCSDCWRTNNGATNCSKRVLRGGGWNRIDKRCRVSHRSYGSPEGVDYDSYGFRLVLSL